ncbi:unnamed protein product [Echinostoma caproni]|uniref:ADP-ribosylation factor n=1 Tax=Echinostoma caproni TaxID=27848 RepID=A0A183A0B0_9TREM|nr:unnamed protein product [Echinostoma caproni]
MGMFISSLLDKLWSKKEVRILMVGLDAAGKTTILYKLKLNEIVTTIPTIGFNVETVEYKNISFTVWDVGGQKIIRPLWRHYYDNAKAIIFVVDSNDTERIDEAREELHALLNEDKLREAILLVFANKQVCSRIYGNLFIPQDLPNALSTSEVAKGLGMTNFQNRKWFIQSSCAATGDGIYSGLDWLCTELKRI